MDEEFEDLERYVNFKAIALLDGNQYPMLLAAMDDWCKDHAESDPGAVALLKSIKFKRVQ